MMSASNWIISVCLLTCFLICSASKEIRAKSGDDVTLQCQGPRDAVMVKWIRPDLKSNGSVFWFKDNNIQKLYQHESFHGRVELRDPQRKDGDVSVILKNVNIQDTGTYECYVGNKGNRPQVINIITLTVRDSGDAAGHKKEEEPDGNNSGHVGLTVGLSVVGLIVVVCFLIYKKRGGLTENNSNQGQRKRQESKAEEETELQLRNDTLKPEFSVT